MHVEQTENRQVLQKKDTVSRCLLQILRVPPDLRCWVDVSDGGELVVEDCCACNELNALTAAIICFESGSPSAPFAGSLKFALQFGHESGPADVRVCRRSMQLLQNVSPQGICFGDTKTCPQYEQVTDFLQSSIYSLNIIFQQRSCIYMNNRRIMKVRDLALKTSSENLGFMQFERKF